SYIKLSLPNEREDGTRDKSTISERYDLSFTEVLEESADGTERVVTLEQFKFNPSSEVPEVIHTVETLMQQWDEDERAWVPAPLPDHYEASSESYLLSKQLEERRLLTGIPTEKLEYLDRVLGLLAGEDADHQTELINNGLMQGDALDSAWPDDVTS